MKIKSLTLYKTTLDSNYSNVIDGGRDDSFTNVSFKENIFDAYYQPHVIYNDSNNIKSVKEVDGNCDISIARDYSELISDGYNYAIIDNGNKFFYYFIIGMESLNDGDNPSMILSLKRDAWSNNIEYFTNGIKNDSNNIVRSHFRRWYTSGGLFYPYYYKSDDGTVFTKLKKEEPLYYGGGGNVIWCGVRFSRDTITDGSYGSGIINTIKDYTKSLMPDNIYTIAQKTKISNDFANSVGEKMANGESLLNAIRLTLIPDDEDGNAPFTIDALFNKGGWKTISDTNWFGASVYEAASPLYFFPVAILTGVSDGIPNYTLSFTMSKDGSTFSYDFTNPDTIMSVFNFGAEEIQDAFLTLCPPINYSVSGSNITINSAVGISTKKLRNSLGTKNIFPATDIDISFAYIYGCPVSSTSKTIYDTYINDITGFSPDSNIGQSLFNPYDTYDSVKMYEPRIYCTPYTDVTVRVGNYVEQVPIVFDRTNIKLVFAMGNKSEPNVSLFLNDVLISAYNNIGSIGKLPTSYDKWKDFGISQLINMGQSAVNSYSPGRVSSTSRSVTSTVSDTGGQVTSGYVDKNKKGQVVRRHSSEKLTGPRDVTTSTSSSSTSNVPASFNAAGLVGSVVRGVGQGLEITGHATAANMPSVLANNNIEHQIPRIVTEQWADERELYDLLANLHLYGYTHGEVNSVKNNCRTWWDFCRTEGCSLPNLTNYNDRYEIENAFNNGVTKWHAELSGFGFLHTFDRNRNNIEREWVNAETSYAYFKFTSDTPNNNFGTSGEISTVSYSSLTDTGASGNITMINVPNGNGYSLLQFKLKTAPSNNYIELKPYVNGAYRLYTSFSGGKFNSSSSIACTIDELIDKTVSLSYGGNKVRLWIDGVLIGEVNNAYNYNYDVNGRFMINVGTGTISSVRVYEAKGSQWTDQEIRDRQLR